jgi:hypothetical protein
MTMTNLFLKMLLNLRQEEIMLYDNLLTVQEAEEKEVLFFLEMEYQEESSNYPHQAPAFHPEAAIWAAKTVYFAAQLILYRENQVGELKSLLPSFDGVLNAEAILSADLSFRFLPAIITKLKIIDPEDALIEVLEMHLITWNYSAVGYDLDWSSIDFDAIKQNSCLYQLYLDRIIEHKVHALASIPPFQQGIQASLGWHANLLWSDLNLNEPS